MVPARKNCYRSDLFEPSALSTIESIENVTFEFKAIVNGNNLERVLADVIAHETPAIVRLVLSCLDQDLIMKLFPTTPEGFATSLAYQILSQLSVLFLFAPPTHLLIPNHHQLVKEAPKLLSSIDLNAFVNDIQPDREAHAFRKGKGISQKKAKMARRGAVLPQSTLDAAPLERLGISVPETREEAEKAIELIMTTQKSILTCYLESLQIPHVAASVKEACIIRQSDVLGEALGESQSNAEHAPDADSDAASPSTTIGSPIASTQRILQPLDFSTLYRKNAKGFGNWSINIAQRAEKDLRQYYHRNRSAFSLIVKKMRELSNGDFRQANHTQLNNSHVEIPIYEARIIGDLRVVYQIDCTPLYETKIEQQVLKVFGIYEDEPVSGSFWSSVGRELGKKGEEYKYRCTLRQRSYSSEDGDVFIPATFPPLGEIQLSSDGIPDLPSDDVEQIQALLLKTVHFSQPLLESIIADLDVQFVLQISPREQTIIQYPFSCYVLGRSGTGKTTTMLYKMLLVEVSAHFAIAETPKLRQLFVTQSRILAEKVGEHFAKLLAGYKPATRSQTLKAVKKADRALVDEDEENEWRSDLPKRFSDLVDEDFPLFVSFDQLCTLVERDMEADASVARKLAARLTYDKFRQAYWPHFSQNLTKGLEPSLVFSEILGVIMGSEKTLSGRSESSFLDRGTYLALGERSQSTFAGQRDRIYDLFESYQPKKRVLGDTDAADRTHAILGFFRNHGIPGRKIDYLYVDEAQDNLLIDTLLLRSICQNPNGLFWAGDTAQTISVGSSFRFNELKAFLFRVEKQRQKKHPELDYHPAERPQQFQLTVNYRSHAGIVNCARTVIEVITKLWPNSIDQLDRERGTVDGLRPMFFTSWDSEQSNQLLFGDHETGQYVELGAHQCILVRSDITKAKLQKQVGDVGLIMTLNECKGLEFNDVIIYNFFDDSNMSESQWRVVLNALEPGSGHTISLPKCDSRHAGVCAELKFLYVAITRARNKVWIVDCSSKGEPMRTLWASKNQVQNCTLGADTPRFAISSTPQEWEEQGGKLFNNKRYAQAKLCYERAYLPHKAAIASAYHMRQEAGDMVGGTRTQNAARQVAFQAVAAAFLDCGRVNSSKAYFRIAGDCFEKAGDDPAAIQAYSDANEFTKVAELYRKLGQFDEAVETVQKHRDDVARDVYNNVINVARLFYFKQEEFKKAIALFESSHEKCLDYLETRGMDITRGALLESLGRFSDAAELYMAEGRTIDAIALFIQDREDREQSSRRAGACIIDGLWRSVSFAVTPDSEDPFISRLLQFKRELDMSVISETSRDELSMFQFIVDRAVSKLESLGLAFSAANNHAVALLCLDYCFASPPKIQALQVSAVVDNLCIFQAYVRTLHHFAFSVDPCSTPEVEKLFGYTKEGETGFSIPAGTFLYNALHKYQHPACSRSSDSNILLTGAELRDIFYKAPRSRLADRVREENQICWRTKAFFPCMGFAVFGRCNRVDCPEEHVSGLNPQNYNLRVRIHLQQILIYHSLHSIEEDQSQRRFWITQLYSVLNPASHHLGSAASLDIFSIPEAALALNAVKEWVRNWAYTLEFIPESAFITHLIQIASIASAFDRKRAMSYLIFGPFMTNPRKPLQYMRRPEDRYIVGEFLSALDGQEHRCLSAGVIFLHHIIQKGLEIHISVLCDLADRLCASLIVSYRQQNGPLHDVTLPLSWLVKWHNIGANRDTSTVNLLASALSELLEPIYSGVGAYFLLFEGKRLQNLGYNIKNIFLARICRCMCLLAYNFRSWWLRTDVLNWITSLRRKDPSRYFHPLFSKYVNSDSWTNLIWAMRSSIMGSSLDEMVQLLHAEQSQPAGPVRGVRRIVYKMPQDIPKLLGSSPELSSEEESTVALAELKDYGDDVDVLEDNGAMDSEERLDQAPVDMPSVAEAVARSPEELQAAAVLRRVILSAHRRLAQHKRGAAKSSLAAGLSEFFAACRAESGSMSGPYRAYFLGPLPHLLLCLDIVHTRAQKEVKQLRKDFAKAEHEALEQLDKRMTDVQRVLKEVIAIQRELKPTAAVHANRDLQELKRLANKAVAILEALPFGTPPGVQDNLGIAFKGILKPRSAPKQRRTEPKPKLNTMEEMCYLL